MMKSLFSLAGLTRRTFAQQAGVAAAMAAMPALGVGKAAAQQAQPAAGPGFAFAVCGDTRPMMYLPYKQGQPDLTKLFVEMFGLVMPEKVAEAVVQKNVKTIFDPATGELIRIIMPFESRSEVMTLTVDKGWVTEASVEDVKLLPGVHRTMFRLAGGDWVAREIVKDVQAGRAKFVVNSGDVVWWGNQGLTLADSPYWQRVNDTMLKQLPAPTARCARPGWTAGGSSGWAITRSGATPQIDGVLSAVPYLKKLGVTPDRLIYKFDFKGVRFIFLWSGKYDYRSPSLWDADRPKYAEQMQQLQQWMDEAKAAGIRKAFIVFHYPVFARSGLGPIPAPDNPHKVIASYAKDMEIVVFNGHVHTTEIFDVDGVKYLMLGGGGAEQDPILPGRTSIKVPADYPPDLYWKGEPPTEEYNYVLVDVEPGQKTRLTLNRFRPESAEPFGTEELFT